MAEMRIEVPGDGTTRFVETKVAAIWLGISERAFERMADRETWVRRVKGAKMSLWEPLDIAILAHMMAHRESQPGDDEPPLPKKS